MEFWNRAARSGEGVGQLRDFLQSLKLSVAVKSFVANATPEEIREKLLEPLKWELEQGSIEDIKDGIRRKLMLYGDSKFIPVDDAENVAPHLFEKAAQAASGKGIDRILYYADFLKIFREKTSRRMDRSELHAINESFRFMAVADGSIISDRIVEDAHSQEPPGN